MIEYEKAKFMLERWLKYDASHSFPKGVPDYPTNTAFIKAINEELTKDMDRIVLNTLDAKQSRIHGRLILLNVLRRYTHGTTYTAEEILSIMIDN
ncbi:hypothetical protein [Paenibacillus polymyxa]|uniref:Uncharacterized protein n=1 Tax=Paenibacillus polymyxa (strain SC2) TaxID=886882 RepID=E3EKX4_PAEPS|nr:hypothetical protein [Paenibacillus polymyxa]ADO59879.1 hypothetical protein PPSC2_25770 [Paenibacillus polymyxa SC2]WPQ59895.1 hypothetical protein SKN87_26970 [Paenibacillus polymyxa]